MPIFYHLDGTFAAVRIARMSDGFAGANPSREVRTRTVHRSEAAIPEVAEP
jgi:hypothetical protein